MKSGMNTVVDKSVRMPFCLLYRPLKFGDREQIEAIWQVEERMTVKAADLEPGVNRYEVTVEQTVEYTTTVEAATEDEAIEEALDEDHGNDMDITTRVKLLSRGVS